MSSNSDKVEYICIWHRVRSNLPISCVPIENIEKLFLFHQGYFILQTYRLALSIVYFELVKREKQKKRIMKK